MFPKEGILHVIVGWLANILGNLKAQNFIQISARLLFSHENRDSKTGKPSHINYKYLKAVLRKIFGSKRVEVSVHIGILHDELYGLCRSVVK